HEHTEPDLPDEDDQREHAERRERDPKAERGAAPKPLAPEGRARARGWCSAGWIGFQMDRPTSSGGTRSQELGVLIQSKAAQRLHGLPSRSPARGRACLTRRALSVSCAALRLASCPAEGTIPHASRGTPLLPSERTRARPTSTPGASHEVGVE